MSTKVVPAPADHAKRPVRSDKPANQTEKQQAAHEDDVRLAQDDSEDKVSVAKAEDEHREATAQDTSAPVQDFQDLSMAGDFSFGGALADAAASSGSLISEAEDADEVGYGQFGDGSGSTILLIGAVALVALGIVVLADNNNKDEAPAPVEGPVEGPASQAVTTNEDTAKTGTITLDDPDDAVTFAIKTAAAHGTATLGTDGAFTYTPAADYNGTDSFVVTGTSADGSTADQTVNVTITAVNDDPFPLETNETAFDVAKNGSHQFVIDFGDVDSDLANLTASATDPEHGSIDPTTNTYTPDADYTGADTFDVTVSDGDGGSYTYTIDVTVLDRVEESIDVPASGPAVTIDADGGPIVFTDDVSERTDVILTNFSADDSIEVSGIASQDDYSFTSAGGDIKITFNDGTDFTQIIIDGGAVNPGFDFITIA